MNSSNTSNRIFIFRPIRAMMPRNLPSKGMALVDHWPWAGFFFSFSGYSSWLVLNRGRLLDRRRMWRVKKPLFCVEKDG